MSLNEQLAAAREEVLGQAVDALTRARLPHYEEAGAEASAARLAHLYDLVLDSLEARNLAPVTSFAETLAGERFEAGFDIAEVQTAFNVLEEAIWRTVLSRLRPEELVEAAAQVGTVLGVGKDVLARRWVSLASHRHVPSLDVRALFGGATG